eukprot:g6839.t1
MPFLCSQGRVSDAALASHQRGASLFPLLPPPPLPSPIPLRRPPSASSAFSSFSTTALHSPARFPANLNPCPPPCGTNTPFLRLGAPLDDKFAGSNGAHSRYFATRPAGGGTPDKKKGKRVGRADQEEDEDDFDEGGEGEGEGEEEQSLIPEGVFVQGERDPAEIEYKPFVPDEIEFWPLPAARDQEKIAAFLKKHSDKHCDIAQHAAKFLCWEDLMTARRRRLKYQLEIPIRERKRIRAVVEAEKRRQAFFDELARQDELAAARAN